MANALARSEKFEPPRHVYLIAAYAANALKIGSAFDVRLRLREIQSYCPVPLVLVGVVQWAGAKVEQQLHRDFAAFLLHGEWYDANFQNEITLAFSRLGAVSWEEHRDPDHAELGRVLGLGDLDIDHPAPRSLSRERLRDGGNRPRFVRRVR
ncbi:MAG TPA: GIY-YIG nuclease family protein [Kofleriaceae bacterium]|nr:GIY-YIG nuclease family protein [Kofleriaceae bacterium]